ncbi:MAG TPA: glycosyltransferase N-terminal domain-containing protein [Saprospiraceae bacterium]|nr:glycosyltransferase N-terminal domain-containing protein [Saprospiraceae bacterium]
MLSFVYTIFVGTYFLLLRFFAFFNSRADLWVKERQAHPLHFPDKSDNEKRYWIHCASLGEFDQAKPILERLESESDVRIFISFFSPSGYRQVAHQFSQYHFFYLPADLPWKMNQLFKDLKPDILLFVKYELWYHCLRIAKKKGIPAYLFSAYFHSEQSYFRWPFRSFYRRTFHFFEKIFVLDNSSKQLLLSKGFHETVIAAGDTRIEQCLKQAEQKYQDALLEDFCRDEKVLICGSTWPLDEKLLAGFAGSENHIKFIIAPHDLSEKHLLAMEKTFAACKFAFSTGRKSAQYPIEKDTQILIWDQMGSLKYIYRYADVTYVGGGFTGKLHNVLEPAAYFKPILIGPKNKRFPEAAILKQKGLLKMIAYNEKEMSRAFKTLISKENLQKAEKKVKNYFFSKRDAAKMILIGIKE